MALRTDYKNAVFSGKRKYHLIENEDGTVSLLDATQYSQTGDKFGAKDVNDICAAVNSLTDSWRYDSENETLISAMGSGSGESGGNTGGVIPSVYKPISTEALNEMFGEGE